MEYVKQKLPSLSRETIEHFKKQNAEPSFLDNCFQLDNKFVVLTEARLDELRRKGWFWDSFYREFPTANGHLRLSRPGFDSGQSQALVYVEEARHSLSGGSFYVLFVRQGSDWLLNSKIKVLQF